MRLRLIAATGGGIWLVGCGAAELCSAESANIHTLLTSLPLVLCNIKALVLNFSCRYLRATVHTALQLAQYALKILLGVIVANFKRYFILGACYFFTLVTAHRQPVFSEESNVAHLRLAFRKEMQRRPFEFQAVVIMPDHLHALWQLPVDDFDYSSRWKEIKKHVSKSLDANVWQKSFWEHTIRDESDWRNHVDYIHYNPVRHGYVKHVRDWKNSSFHRWCDRGFYERTWGNVEPSGMVDIRCE